MSPVALPLQSQAQSPDLPLALLLFAILCVVGAVVGAVGSAVVRRLSNPVGKYRLLYALVVLPFALLAYGLLAALDLGLAVRTALVPGLSGLPGAVVAAFVTMLAGSVAGLAAYAPTIRGVRAVRGIDLSTPTALAEMGRYAVGVSAVFALVYAPLRVGTAGFSGGDAPSAAAMVAGIAVLVAAVLAAAPWVVGLTQSTREPTAAETERLDALRERAGLGVRDARVLEAGDAETARTYVRGLAGTRRLFVSDAFLDAFDDRTAAALLAVQAGRLRSRALVVRMGAVLAAVAPLAFAVTTGPLWPLVAVAAVALVGGLWAARRAITAADDHAAERVGADALAAAFERYADFHALEPSRRRVPNPVSATVPLGDRIDRLDPDPDAGDGADGESDDGATEPTD